MDFLFGNGSQMEWNRPELSNYILDDSLILMGNISTKLLRFFTDAPQVRSIVHEMPITAHQYRESTSAIQSLYQFNLIICVQFKCIWK